MNLTCVVLGTVEVVPQSEQFRHGAHRSVIFRVVIFACDTCLAIDAPHRHIRAGERPSEARIIFAAQTRIRELTSQRRVVPGSVRRGPAHR